MTKLKLNDHFISTNAYFEIDTKSNDKYEYSEGEIFLMVGASPEHNTIVSNILVLLSNYFKSIGQKLNFENLDCRVLTSTQKVAVQDKNYFYPDILIVCGKIESPDNDSNIILNPKVLVEVLSPSTEIYDRTIKLFKYQQIPALKEYLIVHQSQQIVELYSRDSEGWRYYNFEFLKDSKEKCEILLKSIGCTLQFKDVYEKVF